MYWTLTWHEHLCLTPVHNSKQTGNSSDHGISLSQNDSDINQHYTLFLVYLSKPLEPYDVMDDVGEALQSV